MGSRQRNAPKDNVEDITRSFGSLGSVDARCLRSSALEDGPIHGLVNARTLECHRLAGGSDAFRRLSVDSAGDILATNGKIAGSNIRFMGPVSQLFLEVLIGLIGWYGVAIRGRRRRSSFGDKEIEMTENSKENSGQKSETSEQIAKKQVGSSRHHDMLQWTIANVGQAIGNLSLSNGRAIEREDQQC